MPIIKNKAPKMIKKEAGQLKKGVVEKIITFFTGGLSLVAALAWNEAIKQLFIKLFGDNRSSLWAQFTYAITITVIIVIFTIYLTRLLKKYSK